MVASCCCRTCFGVGRAWVVTDAVAAGVAGGGAQQVGWAGPGAIRGLLPSSRAKLGRWCQCARGCVYPWPSMQRLSAGPRDVNVRVVVCTAACGTKVSAAARAVRQQGQRAQSECAAVCGAALYLPIKSDERGRMDVCAGWNECVFVSIFGSGGGAYMSTIFSRRCSSSLSDVSLCNSSHVCLCVCAHMWHKSAPVR